MAAYDNLYEAAGKQFDVDPTLLKLVTGSESAGDPNAVSPKGATGLMQLMPDTARELGVSNPKDPVQNIFGGAKYLSAQLDKYPLPIALAAYNAGPGAVEKHGGMPPFPETHNYVTGILNAYTAGGAKADVGLPPSAQPTSDAGVPAPRDPFASLQGGAATAAAPEQGPRDPFAGLSTTKQATAPVAKVGAPGASVIPGTPPQGTAKPDAAPPTQTAWELIKSLDSRLSPAGMLGTSGNPATDAINAGAGMVRGAGSIGATAIRPFESAQENAARRTSMDQGLQSLVGADPASGMYGAGKLGAEVAGTAGGPALIGQGLRALPVIGGALGPLANAIQSGGMTTGNTAKGFVPWIADKATRVVGGALSGGTQAGMVDPATASTGAFIGGSLAPTVGVAGSIGRSLANTVMPVINPSGYVARGITAMMSPQEAAQAAHGIANAPTYVPGSTPTAAQVSGSPLLLQTEKAAGNIPGIKAAQMASQVTNNDARWAALNGVAGTPQALQTAIEARAAATKPLYETAHQATAQVGPVFDRFAQIPEVQQAMQAGSKQAQLAAEGARARGEPFTPPIWPDANSRTINGAALDYTSRALDGMIDKAVRAGDTNAIKALTSLQKQIDQWGSNFIPSVGQASGMYARASVPINTMQAGQSIADALGTKGRMLSNAAPMEGAPQITMPGYQGALATALKNAKFGIEPGAQQTLENIGQDLQRGSISNSVRSPGSDTAYNLAAQGALAKALYGSAFQGGGAPLKLLSTAAAAFGGHHAGGPLAMLMAGGAGYGTAAKLGQFVGHRLEGALAQHLVENPSGLVPYLNARATQPAIGSNVVPQLITRTAPVALSQP